jgi:hypothetical protein
MSERPSFGSFSDGPRTLWEVEPDEPDRRMRLLDDFTFTSALVPSDPWGQDVWRAGKDSVINGLSIPSWALTPLNRTHYRSDARRASVIHDVYIERAKVEFAKDQNKGLYITRRSATDRMFLVASLAGGCSWGEAAIFYLAVALKTAQKKSQFKSKRVKAMMNEYDQKGEEWSKKNSPRDLYESMVSEIRETLGKLK